MSGDRFSQRHGMASSEAPITIRYEAPKWLRDFIIITAQDVGLSVERLRDMLCLRLLASPDRSNWSSNRIEGEVKGLFHNAEWYHVYDFCEDISDEFQSRSARFLADDFSKRLNDALKRGGVGWQMIKGRLETRGEESFEASVRGAISIANELNKSVTSNELHEALLDLSRRPVPDTTGAIQHAMAALECATREVTADKRSTLGELMNRHRDILPEPLNTVVQKIWGYSSERGRHLRENQPPLFEDAELLVGLSGTLCTYLLRKFSGA